MSKVCTIPAFSSDFKVSVIGCGNVGAAAAYAMLIDGTPAEVVLVDRKIEKAQALALDFEHSMAFYDNTKVTASDDYAACADSSIIVITAGARQKEGETRLDLVAKNKAIFAEIIPALAKAAPNSILVIVSNPVDVLTYEAVKLSGFPENRVFGTGTMLDTARFKFHLSEKLCMSPHSVNAFILGEHGDTSFPALSSANVAGVPLLEMEHMCEGDAETCYSDTRNAAYDIIKGMGYTCYSIGIVIREIMSHIYHHSKVVLPLSVVLHDYYGHSDVALSVPCILDSTGVAEQIKLPLNQKEQEQLSKSVETLKSYL
ncbi:L-lactate dehydrogenase [Candidatus Peregrinibacteria bacterium]|jgi:L-lactate dehydrogenase|nr:L-lactate dehydrogenase [Candidatus Peregrinibacteria bacterium]MBT4632236.1 L-lactate dehydrogenase [Candidatus Peregrinibacteria bacterium]MBT5516679.1 L-lactate dehydrogenase [Candidatus Peregrinibacteria bacterium]MBT5824353.1 L-lactate dehydrogenase [Candidatus Peregrinibacteria bacterium]